MSDNNSSDPLRKTDLSDPLRQMSLDDSSKKGKKKKESDSDRFESLEKRLDKMNDSFAKFFAQMEEKGTTAQQAGDDIKNPSSNSSMNDSLATENYNKSDDDDSDNDPVVNKPTKAFQKFRRTQKDLDLEIKSVLIGQASTGKKYPPVNYHIDVFDKTAFPTSKRDDSDRYKVQANPNTIADGTWPSQTMELTKKIGYMEFPATVADFGPAPDLPSGAHCWHNHVRKILTYYMNVTDDSFSAGTNIYAHIISRMRGFHARDQVVAIGMRYAEVSLWVLTNTKHEDTMLKGRMLHRQSQLSGSLMQAIERYTDFTAEQTALFYVNILHGRLFPKLFKQEVLDKRELTYKDVLTLYPGNESDDAQPVYAAIARHYTGVSHQPSLYDSNMPLSLSPGDMQALVRNTNGSNSYYSANVAHGIQRMEKDLSPPPTPLANPSDVNLSPSPELLSDCPVVSSSSSALTHALVLSAPRALYSSALPSVQSTDWVLDSGATHHFCNDRSLFTTYRRYDHPENIDGCAEGIKPQARGEGTVALTFDFKFKQRPPSHMKAPKSKTIVLHNVQYAPQMSQNLLSPHSLAMHEDARTDFYKSVYTSKYPDGSLALAKVDSSTNLAIVQGKPATIPNGSESFTIGGKGPLRHAQFSRGSLLTVADSTSHVRLAHASLPTVQATLKGGLSTGLQDTKLQNSKECHCCGTASQKTPKHVTGNSSPQRPLDVISCDTIHQTVTSSMGYNYAVLIKEQYTKFMAVFLISDKSQASKCVISFIRWAERQLSCFPEAGRTRTLHLDQGTEYNELYKYAELEGINVFRTETNDHSGNGSIEGSIGQVRSTTRKLLQDANIPLQMWDFSILHAVSIHNILYHANVGSSPYVLFYRRVPNLSLLRAFGSVCYVVNPDHQRGFKLLETALMGIYVGHIQYGKLYLVWDPRSGLVCQSGSVHFLESRRLPDYMKRHPDLDKPRLVQKSNKENPSSILMPGHISSARPKKDSYTSNDFGFTDIRTDEDIATSRPPFPKHAHPRAEPSTDGSMDIPDYYFGFADSDPSGAPGSSPGEDLLFPPATITFDEFDPAKISLPTEVCPLAAPTHPDTVLHVDSHFSQYGSQVSDSPAGPSPAPSESQGGTIIDQAHVPPTEFVIPTNVLPQNVFSTVPAAPGADVRPYGTEDGHAFGSDLGCYADIPSSDDAGIAGLSKKEPQIVLPPLSTNPLTATAPFPVEHLATGEAQIMAPTAKQLATRRGRGRPPGSKNKQKLASTSTVESPAKRAPRAGDAARALRQAKRSLLKQHTRAPPALGGSTSSVSGGQGDPMAMDTSGDSTQRDDSNFSLSGPGDQGDVRDAPTAPGEGGNSLGDTPVEVQQPAPSFPHSGLSSADIQQTQASVQRQIQQATPYLTPVQSTRLLRDAVPGSKRQRGDGSETGRTLVESEVDGDLLAREEAAFMEKYERSGGQHRKRMRGYLAKRAKEDRRGLVEVEYYADDGLGGSDSYLTTTVTDAGQECLPGVLLPNQFGLCALTVSVVVKPQEPKKEVDQTPVRYKQAMALPDKDLWKQAMKEEMKSITDNDVFEWVDIKEADKNKILPSRWVYNRKFNLDGSLERHKARVVAKGFMQKADVDYFMSFSPVIRFESVRFLLAFATYHEWPISQMDVKTAFLYGDIDTETYMRPPDGFPPPDGSSKVWKLKKSLYGLVQAPRCWNQKLHEVLTKYGLKRHQSDHGLYSNKSSTMFVGVYVDDLLITGSNNKVVTKLKNYLSSNFQMKDLGAVSKFLGMSVTKNKGSYSLDMESYINQMDLELDIPIKEKILTPLAPKDLELLKQDSPLTDATVYRQGIGKLSFLAHAVRVDIALAVNFLASFNQAPCVVHQHLLHKLLKYVVDTKFYKITYTKPSGPLVPTVYTDASWGSGYPESEKTYEGLLVLMCGGPICWRSTKQKSISLSTAEAEYMALSEGTKSAKWLTEVFQDFMPKSPPLTVDIFVDNQAAIQIANDPQFYPRTKHIKRRYHFTREAVNNKEVTVSFVESGEQMADFLTKPLVWNTLVPALQRIGLNIEGGRKS